ncbi:hypothetical protein [Nocardiopsis synnemataformans]|uniref:hypothetical protein n=1 Tax=Nocardiopsis synnemataformans TaxID=61305 RepID=UPI003EC06CC0
MEDNNRRVTAVTGAGGLLTASAVLLHMWEERGGPDLTVLACALLGLAVITLAWQLAVFVRLLRRRGGAGRHRTGG